MKYAVAVWLLAALSPLAARAQPADCHAATALFPLFITSDLMDEFVTPGLDSRIVVWFDSPVSKAGALAHREMLKKESGRFAPVPLVLDVVLHAAHVRDQAVPLERRERLIGNQNLHECIESR
jgi:hypothetical protein